MEIFSGSESKQGWGRSPLSPNAGLEVLTRAIRQEREAKHIETGRETVRLLFCR